MYSNSGRKMYQKSSESLRRTDIDTLSKLNNRSQHEHELPKMAIGDYISKNRSAMCKPSVHNDSIILYNTMQSVLEHDYKNREFIINKVNEENAYKIRPLLNKILDDADTLIGEENSVNYQKTIQYIIVTNYMGDPTSPICIQETSTALNIAVDHNQSLDLENQSPYSKEEQLKEIANLVCGIRLCNMDRTDCKEEITDMLDKLPKTVNLLLYNVELELNDCIKRATVISSCLRQFYKVENDIKVPLFIIRICLAAIRNDELDKLKIFLVCNILYKKNLEKIEEDLIKCKYELPLILNKYQTTLKEIRLHFKSINGYVKSELINISAIWTEIIETMNYLSVTTNLILTMKQMINETIDVNEYIKNSQQTAEMFPIVVDKKQQKIIEAHPLNPMCNWYPSSYKMEDGKNLFADGYCVVTMVDTNGMVIEHNKNVGIIQYRDEWFGFTCVQAAIRFGINPAHYLNCFYNLLTDQAHLVSFLHLHERVANYQYICDTLMCEKHINNITITKKDAQVQTIFHLDDTAKTNGYIHSMQDLKHKLDTSKLKKLQGTQTIDVYKTAQVQYGLREIGCNTVSTKSTWTDQFQFTSML